MRVDLPLDLDDVTLEFQMWYSGHAGVLWKVANPVSSPGVLGVASHCGQGSMAREAAGLVALRTPRSPSTVGGTSRCAHSRGTMRRDESAG